MPAAFYVVFCFSLFINDKTFLVASFIDINQKDQIFCLLFCFTKQKRASEGEGPGGEGGVRDEGAQGSPGGAGGPPVRAGQADQLCHRRYCYQAGH